MNRNNARHNQSIWLRSLTGLQLALLFWTPVSVIAASQAHDCELRYAHPALSALPSSAYAVRRTHRTYRSSRDSATGDRSSSRPLWPGSKYTEADRSRALYRGLRFIYRTSQKRDNFDEYGADYLWCFFTLSASVKDSRLSDMARQMGHERAVRWRRTHGSLPADADAGTVADFVFGSDAADNLGVRDNRIKETLKQAAPRYLPRDYLGFDPLTEPPPADVPEACEFDDTESPRGNKICSVCKRPLKMKSRYDVWYDALITVYSGDHYGVKLGAHYPDVLKWVKDLRPYRSPENGANQDFYDEVYAVTHICYTLNNYSFYRLSPELVPQEFAFLKDNLTEAVKLADIDMLGEFMDSLRSLGLTTNDKIIRTGMEYYLSHQNRDGSWGDMDEEDVYNRYHPTWNGIAGLTEYNWHGENLSFPELRPFLQRLNAADPPPAR